MVIQTLSDLHQNFSDVLNEESPPATTDSLYKTRTRWFNLGQDDQARRWFLKSLLKSDTFPIVAGTASYLMPTDFDKPNGLLVFSSTNGGVIYTDPYARSNSVLSITRDFTTGRYRVTFTPTPGTNDTASFWYFAAPPKMVNASDVCLVDGDALIYYALTKYFFTNRQYLPMNEARTEYENRMNEVLANQEIPAPGSLLSMRNVATLNHVGTKERAFYSGNSRRNLG